MTTIGAAWKKTDKNGKHYISVSLDKALLPLTIDESKKLSIFPITDKQSESAPDFRVNMYIPEDKEEKEVEKDIWG